MHVSYQLNTDDVREALGKHGGLRMKALSVVGFFLIAIALWSLSQKPTTYVPTIVPVVMGCFLILLPRLQARQAIKSGSRVLDPVEATISDAGIDASSSVAAMKFTWDAFTRYSETKNLFLVYPGARMFHIYPKRAFTPGDVDTFRGLLELHLGRASKTHRWKISPVVWVWLAFLVAVSLFWLVMPRNR